MSEICTLSSQLSEMMSAMSGRKGEVNALGATSVFPPDIDDINREGNDNIFAFLKGSSLCRPSPNALKDKYASLGYIRAMKSRSRVFIKALIDSGNLFVDRMSERLAKLLNIKYKPCTNKAGTAVGNQKVHVLGLADPFDLALEGLEDPIKIQPYVICSLSHDLNLGEHFLQRFKAGLKFEGNKAKLNLNNHSLELVSRSKSLIRNSKDQ